MQMTTHWLEQFEKVDQEVKPYQARGMQVVELSQACVEMQAVYRPEEVTQRETGREREREKESESQLS